MCNNNRNAKYFRNRSVILPFPPDTGVAEDADDGTVWIAVGSFATVGRHA